MNTDFTPTTRTDFDLWQQAYQCVGKYGGVVLGHNVHGAPITLFSGGEAIIRSHHKDHRGIYSHQNITLWSPLDDHPAVLTRPDGTPVSMAHIKQAPGSTPTFLLDWDHGVAVRLSTDIRQHHPTIPERFSQAHAYCPGKGSAPVGAPVRLSIPHAVTAEEREVLKAFRDRVTAWVALKGIKMPVYIDVADVHTTNHVLSIAHWDVRELSVSTLKQVRDNSHMWDRDVITVPHLLLSRKKQTYRIVPESKRATWCLPTTS